MPPDSCFGSARAKSRRPVRSSASATRRSSSAAPSEWCFSTNATLSRTLSHGSSEKSWKMKVISFNVSAAGTPRSTTSPAVALRMPPAIPSNVDLPHPDGPRIATISPSCACNETPSSAVRSPKRCVMLESAISMRLLRRLQHGRGNVDVTLDEAQIDELLGVRPLLDHALVAIPVDHLVDAADVEPAIDVGQRLSDCIRRHRRPTRNQREQLLR